MLAKQNRPELVALIIAGDKFLLRVGALKLDASRQHTEVAYKIDPQIEHLRPKIWDLLVADALLARHVRARNQALTTGIFPMRLTPHTAHNPIWIKCQVADRINSFFFCLQVLSDRRPVRPREWRIAHEVQIRFCATGDHSETDRKPVPAFCLDVAQDGLAFKAIETFAHRQNYTVFCKIIGEPCASIRIEVAVQQIGITMHHTDLQFHHPQARGRLACKQSAAHDHDASLDTRHLLQCERIPKRSQVNNVAEIDSRYRRADRAASHRQACFVEFNAFAIGKHGQTPLDIELCYYCS